MDGFEGKELGMNCRRKFRLELRGGRRALAGIDAARTGDTRFLFLQRHQGVALDAPLVRTQVQEEPDEKSHEQQADKNG